MSLSNEDDSVTVTGQHGDPQTIDVSECSEVEAEVDGPGGGGSNTGNGGNGGRVVATVNVTGLDELVAWIGAGGENNDTSSTPGKCDGGGGATNTFAGSGGGSTHLEFPDGETVAVADAGGGAGDTDNSGGGGGGARGGEGGFGADDAECSGFGGNGGDLGDGENGGQEANTDHDRVAVVSTTTGGGGAGGTSADTGTNGDDGEITVTVTDGSTLDAPENLVVSTVSNRELSLSWSDVNSDEDGHNVYRDTEPDVEVSDETLVAELGAGVESYTDDGLAEGTEYFYVVTAIRDGFESQPSNEDASITELPAPANVDVATVAFEEVDATWTLESSDEDGVRVYTSTDQGGSYTQVQDLAAGTEATTVTDLLHGQQYRVRIQPYTVDTSSETDSDHVVTDLPDVDEMPLDASVVDELTAEPSTTPALNNGEYSAEIREWLDEDGTEKTEWEDLQTSSFDVAELTFTGLTDGQKYDVRCRSQTEWVTGAYLEASEVTALPAVDDFAAAASEPNQVDTAWTDPTDHEGSYLLRRRSDTDADWSVVETVAADADTAIDDSPYPEESYEYQIRAQTQWVHADSNIDSTSTPAVGVPKTRTRRSRWVLEIEHPNEQDVLRPTVLDGVEWAPTVNGRPTLRVPVPRREKWLQDGLPENAGDVRVWHDGDRLPIDELVAIEPSTDSVALKLSAGRQLKQHVETIQVDEGLAHETAAGLIEERTDYVANVDDPSVESEADVVMLRSGTLSEFRDRVIIPPTTPAAVGGVTGDGLHMLETASFVSSWGGGGGDGTLLGGASRTIGSDKEWVDREVAILSNESDGVQSEITPAYDVPTDSIELGFYLANPDGDNPPFEIRFDGVVVETVSEGALLEDDNDEDTRWFQSLINNDALSPGSYDISLELTGSNGNNLVIDVVAGVDRRYSYDFDAETIDGGIDGPQLFPGALQILTVDTSSVRRVLSGRLTVDINDTSNNQALAVSNDGGTTWLTESNTDDSGLLKFADAGQEIEGRFTLSRFGSGSGDNTPETGFETQAIESFELLAEVDDTPVLLDKQYSGRLDDILFSEIADAGDFVAEVRRDPAADPADADGLAIEWTQAGQRDRNRTVEPAVDVSGSRSIEGSADRIIVSGASRSVEDERFDASDWEDLVVLDEAPIVVASEAVVDPDTGEEFERGDDYRMQWFIDGPGDTVDAGIELLEDGEMELAKEYAIDYRWRYRGEASTPEVDDPRTETVRVSNATSDRECEQLALAVLKRVQEPLEEVTLTVATDDPTQSLVEALSHDQIPFDGSYVVRDKSVESDRVTWHLGSREGLGNIVDEIREQFRGLHDQS